MTQASRTHALLTAATRALHSGNYAEVARLLKLLTGHSEYLLEVEQLRSQGYLGGE